MTTTSGPLTGPTPVKKISGTRSLHSACGVGSGVGSEQQPVKLPTLRLRPARVCAYRVLGSSASRGVL